MEEEKSPRRYLRAIARAAMHIITEGFTDRFKTYMVIYDEEFDRPVAKWDWGEDYQAAIDAVSGLQAELRESGLTNFCEKYNLR